LRYEIFLIDVHLMKDLLIIGARALGREIFKLSPQFLGYKVNWSIKGYLDDKKNALDDFPGFPSIIDSVESYEIQPNDVFVCALGDVYQRHKYVQIIKDKGGYFISLIHSSSIILNEYKHNEGLIVLPFTFISCNTELGDFNTMLSFSVIGHDVMVGNFCQIGTHSFLGGHVKTGNFVTIHTGAKIIPHTKIGNNTTIGVGSVVIKDTPDNCSVFGNPAKKIYTR